VDFLPLVVVTSHSRPQFERWSAALLSASRHSLSTAGLFDEDGDHASARGWRAHARDLETVRNSVLGDVTPPPDEQTRWLSMLERMIKSHAAIAADTSDLDDPDTHFGYLESSKVLSEIRTWLEEVMRQPPNVELKPTATPKQFG
jgi:hypothetical protein